MQSRAQALDHRGFAHTVRSVPRGDLEIRVVAVGPDGIPRLALNQEEAAAAVGLSVNSFKEHVRPRVKRVDVGRRVLFPVAELQAWLDRNARLP
jgi:hypothetical protein